LKKPFVAIVDDDSGFANYLRTFLSLRGYETRAYSRGDEMIASVKQGDPPDVVLLDVMMPGMNGLETLRALKTAKPDVQVIMLSGREHASTIVEAVRLGAADYVVKPDDPEGLGEIALDAADVEAAGTVAELRARCEENDRDAPRALVVEQVLRDAPTVEPRHHHVEQDDVGMFTPRLVEPARPVGGLEHLHPLRLEVDAAEQPDRRLVVDDEHPRRP